MKGLMSLYVRMHLGLICSPIVSSSLLTQVNPGDFIYFPDRYWHATINLDPYTVFVSTFTTEHPEGQLDDEL